MSSNGVTHNYLSSTKKKLNYDMQSHFKIILVSKM